MNHLIILLAHCRLNILLMEELVIFIDAGNQDHDDDDDDTTGVASAVVGLFVEVVT